MQTIIGRYNWEQLLTCLDGYKFVFFDFETTGIDVFQAEIITGYLETSCGDSYYIQSKVDNWSDDAAEIHGITYGEMLQYEDKSVALKGLYQFVEKYKDYVWLCYANPKTLHGYIYYDKGVMLNQFLEQGLIIDLHRALSVYDLAVLADAEGKFKPLRNPKTGRKSFKQENVYKALFNCEYNAHDAKQDVQALMKIYSRFVSLFNNTSVNSDQLALLI